MTYSNTKRDKKQTVEFSGIKNLALTTILVLITFSSVYNIVKQAATLKSAKSRNEALNKRIDKLIEENRILDRQIEEATKSISIERKQREYFGRGGVNDYWLLLPTPADTPLPKTEVNEQSVKPKVLMWWELFTK